MGRPLVSVIIPTYNRASLLPRAVESVLAQTVRDLELIIVDDGSTDDTASVVQAMTDPRIRYIRQENRGACAARNHGIDEAGGRLIAFQDSDDVWYPEKLERQLAVMEETGADMVFCAFRRLCPEKEDEQYPPADEPAGVITAQRLLGGNMVSTQTVLGRAEFIRSVRFDERMPRMQDWDFAISAAKQGVVYYDGALLVDMHVQTDSISRSTRSAVTALRLLIRKNREHYAAHFDQLYFMLVTLTNYAAQLGEMPFADWLRWFPRAGVKENLKLMKGVLLCVRQRCRKQQ